MADHLWSPWRMQYIQEAKEEPDGGGCVFCAIPADRVRARPHRAASSRYVVLNKFPYNPGHLLVVPLRHVGDLEEVTADENAELQLLLQRAVGAIRRTADPHGFNVGLNLGRIGGRGHPGAPALARRAPLERRHELHARGRRQTRVLPELLAETYRRLEPGFDAMSEIRSGSFDLPDGSLYFEIAGEGPVVTLIHEGLWDSRTWDPQMPALLDAGYRVVRYDVRGYGRSSRLTGEPYSHVEDLAALLDFLDVPLTTLVGCSMGGAIAIDFTLEHPEPRRSAGAGRVGPRRLRGARGRG